MLGLRSEKAWHGSTKSGRASAAAKPTFMKILESPRVEVRAPDSVTRVVQPVRLVVVGLNFGAALARQVAQSGRSMRIVGVFDLNSTKAAAVAVELGVKAYPTLDAVLASPEVDAVGLFTGPAGRGALIERIINAGKHVMTTKPFELDPVAAERACSAAERADRVLHLNSPAPRAAGDLAIIRRWLQEAGVGRVVALRAQTWADYRERAEGSWLDDPARCPGGPLFRLGVYFLNDFAGLPGRPLEVHVQHTRVRTGRPTADNAQISIRYEGGALGNIFTSFCVGDGGSYRDEVTLVCEHGVIRRWMDRKGGVEMHEDRAVVELQRPGRPVEQVVTVPGDFAGWYNWDEFANAVSGRVGAVRLNTPEILAGVNLLAAMARAAHSGRSELVGAVSPAMAAS